MRRPQLAFIARLAETKCVLLLQRITAEKSIINPKSSPFFEKGQTLKKKKNLLYFVGNPVAVTDVIQNEKEVDSA